MGREGLSKNIHFRLQSTEFINKSQAKREITSNIELFVTKVNGWELLKLL